MPPISVLVTNNALAHRGGSETYVRDVALALLARGHRPAAFSLVLGEAAAELRRATVPVLDDIAHLTVPPDIIHGHHHVETLIAALTFPDVPIVNFCHGWLPWEEKPLHHPSVRLYVAVDEVCVDRLVREEGVPPERVELLLNFVDGQRFAARPPLPSRPSRALVLSNAATPDNYARVIVEAGHAAGMSVDVVGAAAGNASAAPERLLPHYDLVFAKARTALEALTVGCAVVLADGVGAGPLVTPADYDRLRRRNFGVRELTHAHDRAWYASQIARYDAVAAAEVAARVRVDASLDGAVTRLLAIYERARSMPAGTEDPQKATAGHLSRIARQMKGSHDVAVALERARADRSRCEAAFATQAVEQRALRQHVAMLEATLASERGRLQEGERQRDAAGAEVAALRQEIAAFRALPTLRLRDALLRSPLGPGLRRLARLLTRG